MARCCYSILLLLFFMPFEGQSQKKDSASADDCHDFVVTGRQIWELTKMGKLRVLDLVHGGPIDNVPKVDSPVIAIARDRNSNIAVASGGKVVVYDAGGRSWSDLGTYEGQPSGMVFNTSNRCFLITSKGIEDLSTHKFYFSDSSLNNQIHYHGEWSRNPSTYCMDNDDNIWVGYKYGEWGGNLFVFNTATHSFSMPKLGEFQMELNPVQCVFPAGSTVYLSAGLQHMMVSGCIIRFDHLSASFIFASEDDRRKTNVQGEYIGPAAFNPTDHCIYFYSQNGIFKGDPKNDLSTIDKWKKVASPKLIWTYGQPDAVGYSMNVSKMEFTSNGTLVFLTQANGIGVYKRGKTSFLK